MEIKTKKLHIAMSYIYVGDTGIDIPIEILKGKTEEEQLKIAYNYAQEHLDEIPVADNAEYISDSDNFEIEDIDWGDNEEVNYIGKDKCINLLNSKDLGETEEKINRLRELIKK